MRWAAWAVCAALVGAGCGKGEPVKTAEQIKAEEEKRHAAELKKFFDEATGRDRKESPAKPQNEPFGDSPTRP